MKQKIVTIFLIISMMLAFTIPNFADDKPDDFHIFNETSPSEPGFDAKSPFRSDTQGRVEIYYPIISKMNQPRNTNGTNPHGGVDIKADAGTPVYPIADGTVVNIYWDYSGQMGTVWVKHGNIIVLYRHIRPNLNLFEDKEINWYDPIGTVDTVKVYPPAHLHISWCTYETTTYPGNKLYNLYDHVPNYQYGRDCDFFSQPHIVGDTLYIYAYSKGESSGRKIAEYVDVYYKVGNGPWINSPEYMEPVDPADPNNFLWKFDFLELSQTPGLTIEYYLVGYRDDTGSYKKYAFYPAHYYNPPIEPAGYNTFNHPPITKTYTISCNGQHSLSYGEWENVSTESQCQRLLMSCNYCSYSYWVIDPTHAWSNSCDTKCNDCNYTRTAYHSYISEWVDVSQPDICEDLVHRCTTCGHSYIFGTDYTHYYYYDCDSICSDCGYMRCADCSYSGRWVDVCTSSICEKYEAECIYCGDSYVYYDYTHYYPYEFEPICSDCGYRNW